MKLLFWGTQSLFAQSVLTGLCQRRTIQAVMVPAAPAQKQSVAPIAAPSTLVGTLSTTTTQIAWQQQLPIYAIHTLAHADVATLLRTFAPDLVCVACFPWRIPPSLLTIPTVGFVNLHPSLLPAYRGPAPLFWQLRSGLQRSGVTAHWMDATFDTGDIAAQQPLLLPTGASGPDLDIAYAEIGVGLFDALIRELAAGRIPRQPQPRGGAYQPWPQATDFTLDVTWSAQRAFNFMRGTAEWNTPYRLHYGAQQVELTSALWYDPTATLPQPILRNDVQIAIQFTPGVLYATVRPTAKLASAQRSPLDLTI